MDNSLISPGCVVRGRVERSVLGPGVIVEAGATVADSVIFQKVRIASGARVRRALVDEEAHIGEKAQVGRPPELTVVPQRARIAPGEKRGPETGKDDKKKQ